MNQLNPMLVQAMLHKLLKELRDIPVEQRLQHIGLCYMLEDLWRAKNRGAGWLPLDHALGQLFKRWPDGTKCPGYPVPSCKEGVWEGNAYKRACASGTIWKGEYGAARIALLDWLIEETKP